MIELFEDSSCGYPHRTYRNAELSDITIAFAIDFSTAGEKLTTIACEKANKPIFKFQINERGRLGDGESEKIEALIIHIKENNVKNINIAGNGIYSFNKHGITQERIDSLVTNFIAHLLERGCKIETIRSGGQTGADEAGLKAALALGIKAICLCPKKYRFRDANGTDIYSKEEFLKRF